MTIHRIDEQVLVPRPHDEVFDFFSRPENLGHLTPPELSFHILTPSPVAMHEGASIDYRITLGPIPMKWRTLITAYDPPHRFVDEQVKGPYALWKHEHRFEATDDGTLIRDVVDYAMPFGPLGSLVRTLVVKRRLDRIFGYRREAVTKLFSSEKP